MVKTHKVTRDIKSLAAVKPRPVKPKRNAYLNATAIMHMQATEQPMQKNAGLSSKKFQLTNRDANKSEKRTKSQNTKTASSKEQKESKNAKPKATDNDEKASASKQPKFAPRRKRIASLNAQAIMAVSMEKPRRVSTGEATSAKRKSLASAGTKVTTSDDKSAHHVGDSSLRAIDQTIIKKEKCDADAKTGLPKIDKNKANSRVVDSALKHATSKPAIVESSTASTDASKAKKAKLQESEMNVKEQSSVSMKPTKQTKTTESKSSMQTQNTKHSLHSKLKSGVAVKSKKAAKAGSKAVKKTHTLKIRIFKSPIKAKISDTATKPSHSPGQKHRAIDRSSPAKKLDRASSPKFGFNYDMQSSDAGNETAAAVLVNGDSPMAVPFVRPFLGYYGYYSGYSYPVMMPYPYVQYICNQPSDALRLSTAADVAQGSTPSPISDKHHRSGSRSTPRRTSSFPTKVHPLLPRPSVASPPNSGSEPAIKRPCTGQPNEAGFLHSPPPLVPMHAAEQGMSPLIFQLPPSSRVPYPTRLDERHVTSSPIGDINGQTTYRISHDISSPYVAVGPDVYHHFPQMPSTASWSTPHAGGKSAWPRGFQSSSTPRRVSASNAGSGPMLQQCVNSGQPATGSHSKRKKDSPAGRSSDKCVGTHHGQQHTPSSHQATFSMHHSPAGSSRTAAIATSAVDGGKRESDEHSLTGISNSSTTSTASGGNVSATGAKNTAKALFCDTTTKTEVAITQLSPPNKILKRPKRASKETDFFRISVSPARDSPKAAATPKLKKRQNDDASLALIREPLAGSEGLLMKYSVADAGWDSQEKTRRPLKRKSEDVAVTCRWHWKGVATTKVVAAGQNETAAEMRNYYQAIEHDNGDVISVRDCVLIRSGPRKTDAPFVARIAAFWSKADESGKQSMMMTVLWYYRIEHTDVPRPLSLIDCELFASRHRDDVAVTCIEDVCHVLTLNEYCRYVARQKRLARGLRQPALVLGAEGQPAARSRLPAADVSADCVFLCRRVYDTKLKRILRNPCIGSAA